MTNQTNCYPVSIFQFWTSKDIDATLGSVKMLFPGVLWQAYGLWLILVLDNLTFENYPYVFLWCSLPSRVASWDQEIAWRFTMKLMWYRSLILIFKNEWSEMKLNQTWIFFEYFSLVLSYADKGKQNRVDQSFEDIQTWQGCSFEVRYTHSHRFIFQDRQTISCWKINHYRFQCK